MTLYGLFHTREQCLLFTKCQRFSWYDRYFIDVVFVVDDDTYYWVYLSSDHLFQVYYKVRQVLLQSAKGITKCDNLLQSATSITKWDDYYKVRHDMVLVSFKILDECNSMQSELTGQLPRQRRGTYWITTGEWTPMSAVVSSSPNKPRLLKIASSIMTKLKIEELSTKIVLGQER